MPEFYLNEGHSNPGGEDKVIVDALNKIKYREAEDSGVRFDAEEILVTDWSNPMEFHAIVHAIEQQLRTYGAGTVQKESPEFSILAQNIEAAKILLNSFEVNIDESVLQVRDRVYPVTSPPLSERDAKMWELSKRLMANQGIDEGQLRQRELETTHNNLYKLARVEILLAESIAKAQLELGLE